MKTKKIALAGGGTGGHITPLVSIYNKLKTEKSLEFFWIGEYDSLEEKIAKENEIKFYPIKAGKLRRYFSLKTILEPFYIFSGIISSYKILKKEKPTLIFSKGGYVSLPVAISARLLGIKLYLHESDTIPGLVNRLVGKFANKTFLGFEMAKKFFKEEKTQVVGQILNPVLFENIEKIDTKNNNTNLLIIAGSQGSTRIFKTILDNSKELQDFNLFVVLGSLNINLKKDFEKIPNCEVFEFINQTQLASILSISDIAVTRAGATSLAELEAFNISQIIIPLKESANNHQYYNALEYSEKKGEVMIEEKDLSSITGEIKKNIKNKKTLGINNKHGALEIITKELLFGI
ncbi:MAG: UDP-N-acetylglucosamine--N-acetylmuramyl-(pentapeptide) pyrophosphoryl-undecaprenol N-acetylglucosamine transferase [Candidatus Gracilibacteria bacterium]|nr:UDP-N-acetylglucosamine--N-acetylmuramyl-(pentapeptide) pyrophosphoryl-undecaprenol N-acetylglucosamine transferase [Candidatus Gracilibacteria bacterium]MDD2908734.1 UDP-N-acetylglucosamine--N-acetylmuramyl-(pentapeptide) pyrophosphoryl-undecaprenol N-acetylglucosamine transferase [Candidatus Gracilibacteria bacterium]